MMTNQENNKPIRTVPSQIVGIDMPPGTENLPADEQLLIAKDILHKMIMSNHPSIKFED